VGEVLDEVALVGAAGRGGCGPDREGAAAGRGRFDRRDGADDRQRGLVAGAQGGEGVHGGRVAADDQRVGAVGGGRLGDGEGALGEVFRCPRSPGHAVGVEGEHQIGVGAQTPYRGGGRQQSDSGVHERDLHPATIVDEPVRGRGVGQTAHVSAVVWSAAGSLAAWLWLLLCQGGFWRTDVRLPPQRDPDAWPSVCVVVPARDEAEVLPASLPSVLAQDYPGRAEVFLVDDGSTDGTGELARELARRHGGLPLTVGSPGEPPAGWTGKLWAVRHGIALARARDPEYLLLTDADIAH